MNKESNKTTCSVNEINKINDNTLPLMQDDLSSSSYTNDLHKDFFVQLK